MTLDEFASRLEHAKPKTFKGGAGYRARCPSCALNGGDTDGSHFMVYEGTDEWLHVNCVRGCSEQQIMSALGLQPEDRRVKPYEVQEDANKLPVYLYEKVGGGYGAEKYRYKKVDGTIVKGAWRVRFKDGKPLEKIQKVVKTGPRKGETYLDWPTPDDVGLNGELDVLYRFQDVRRAIDKGETIYIGEGEPATEAARKLGICHTCQRSGAGPGKWLPAHTAQLQGAKEIVIIADRDPRSFKPDGSPEYNGEDYAKEVFMLLRAAGLPVRVVRSKTTRDKDDFRDHLEAGFNVEDLVPATDLMPARGISVVTSTEKPNFVRPKYLVDRYLPEGKLVLFDADGKTGKTSLAVAWAASLSLGLHPVRHTRLPQGPVKTLYLHHGEDSNEEVETVFYANGGVEGYLVQPTDDVQRSLKFNRAGLELVRETIIDHNCGLVVVDALLYFLAGVLSNINDALPVMPILEHMTEISRFTGATFLDIRHTTKGVVGKEASDLGMGSVAFRNSHRGQLVARYHPTEKGLVIVEDLGGSLLVERDETFAYRRVGDFGEIQYVETFENPFDAKDTRDSKSKRDVAENWMVANLTGQYVKSQVVYETLEAFGISKRTIDSTCQKLSVVAVKDGTGAWLKHIEPVDPFAD